MHLIYHITTVEQWDEARGRGELTEPSLYTEGFIHFPTFRRSIERSSVSSAAAVRSFCLRSIPNGSMRNYDTKSRTASSFHISMDR